MSSHLNRQWLPRMGRVLLAAAVGLSVAGTAEAGVTRKGDWSEDDRVVSLDLDGVPRNEALKRLADEAGWSVVVNAPQSDPVDVHVKEQPAGKVLDLLLLDGEYVASREGALISIAPRTEDAPPADVAAPSPQADDDDDDDDDGSNEAKERGRDRAVTGSNLRIEKGEVVNDVSVFGGSLEVLGTVTGDISVVGGSVRIFEGARVRGDVETVGGSLTLDNGARIDGDVDVVGGDVKRGDKAIIGGDVSTEGEQKAHEAEEEDAPNQGISLSELAGEAGEAVTRTALLFVFGAVLLALATRRVESLKVDVAAHPMKSFALGIVGILCGIAVFIALCVTVIGIPFAIIGVLLAMFAALAGACAVLETAGAAVLGHRTKNPYVHLAAGCAGLLVLGGIPYLGNVLYTAVFLIGMGAIVSTRAAGLMRSRQNGSSIPGAHPFRTAA